MEVLSVLHVLLRHRALVALGAAAALACGLVAAGKLDIGGLHTASHRSWHAVVEAQVDKPKPLAADAYSSAATIQTQAVLLADHLTTDAARDAMAGDSGIMPASITVFPPAIDTPIRPSPLVTRTGEAFAAVTTEYTLAAAARSRSPLLALVVSGPDRDATRRLAQSAMSELLAVAVDAESKPARRLVVRPLGPPSIGSTVTSRPGIRLGGPVAALLFSCWCAAIVLASGLARRWRDETAPVGV